MAGENNKPTYCNNSSNTCIRSLVADQQDWTGITHVKSIKSCVFATVYSAMI